MENGIINPDIKSNKYQLDLGKKTKTLIVYFLEFEVLCVFSLISQANEIVRLLLFLHELSIYRAYYFDEALSEIKLKIFFAIYEGY